jgi:hypothetical protein
MNLVIRVFVLPEMSTPAIGTFLLNDLTFSVPIDGRAVRTVFFGASVVQLTRTLTPRTYPSIQLRCKDNRRWIARSMRCSVHFPRPDLQCCVPAIVSGPVLDGPRSHRRSFAD